MMIDFDQLYRERYLIQVKVICRWVRGDVELAEDIVQEAYSRAIMYEKSYKPTLSSVNVWFNFIMFNVLREFKNKDKPSISYEEEKHMSIEKITEYADIFNKECSKLQNDKHVHVLVLYYIVGYSSKEISNILEGMSQTNVTTIVGRFKETLSEIYQNEEETK